MRACFLLLLIANVSACGTMEPAFESVLHPDDTYDTAGPYRIEAYVAAADNIDRVSVALAEKPGGDLFGEMSMHLADGTLARGRWVVDLPGRPVGSIYQFYLVARDISGYEVLYPQKAPGVRLEFEILDWRE